jgi:predicted AAA+ superfamily ATPase
MERSLAEAIRRDLNSKLVFISGPRQTGKTTLSKMLFERFEYFNLDLAEHRVILERKSWDRKTDLVVFDELHKKRQWKRWLKGIVDVEGDRPRLLVTGSAKLDLARRVGDSLAGRFYGFRLHPFDLKELCDLSQSEEAFETLLRVGGFPEPFLNGSERFYKRWRRGHLDIILRQDLLDLEAVRDIPAIETLVELLRHRVGSPVSMSNLARDLERDPKTVKRWIDLLENLYVVFRVSPFHRNVARSLLKEPKLYFYDIGQVEGDDGTRLENLVACALKKDLDRIEDVEGERTRLCYLRTKEGREVDFAAMIGGAARWIIEVKTADQTLSPHLAHFGKFLPGARRLQIVKSLNKERTYPDRTEVRRAAPWLTKLDLLSA